jgi:hypothetical protein
MTLHTFHSLFESSTLTPEQKVFLDKYVRGKWVLNPSTGLVDVEGDVDFHLKKIESIPVRFGVVSGFFNCSSNKLTSLVGAPQKVGRDFNCSYNQLVSLKGTPKEVKGDFYCVNNSLTSLVGAPQEVGSSFDCSSNKLTSLEGAPQKVEGVFGCSSNKLTSLVGAPQEVGSGFDCSGNKLTSLVGAPKKVGGEFYCLRNSLTSLVGSPQKVGGDFYCDAFSIQEGKWGIEAWMEILVTGDEKDRSLILTILPPSAINQEMKKNPEVMMIKLSGVWNHPDFADIKKKIAIPSRYEAEMDTLGDLSDLGF